MICCDSQFNVNCGDKANSNATENAEGMANDGEHDRGTGMPRETEIIITAMGIGEYLKNIVAIICLRSVIGVMIFGLGT